MGTKIFFEKWKKSGKNHPKKLYTYGSWEGFFSAALSAQNSPELHFRFIDSSIQLSVVLYFVKVLKCVCMMLRFISTIGSLDNYYITAFWQFFLKMNRVSGNRVIWNRNNGGIFLLVFLINDMTNCIIRIVSHGFFKVIV